MPVDFVSLMANAHDEANQLFANARGFTLDVVAPFTDERESATPWPSFVRVTPGPASGSAEPSGTIKESGSEHSSHGVGLSVRVDDVDASRARMVNDGVSNVHGPRNESYSEAPVFVDVASIWWNLFGPS